MMTLDNAARRRQSAGALALLGLLLLAHPAGTWAQSVYYVRTGATGANNGSDWNNAFAALPASLQRGATYYLAAGTYPAPTFTDPEQGSTLITITSATVSNHGTDTGWAGSYAGQAIFLGEAFFETGYYTVDGQTRGQDWRSGYRIRFWNQGNLYGAAVHLLANHLTFKYVEVQGTTDQASLSGSAGDYGFHTEAQITDLYVGYSYIHETGNTQFQINYGNSDRFTCEYNCIYKNHTAANANHDEAFSLTFSNSIIRYNLIQDIISTAVIATAAAGTPTLANWEIYGNVFFWSSSYQTGNFAFITDGIISMIDQHWSGYFRFYNNTIAGIKNPTNLDNAGLNLNGISGATVYNNLWYDCPNVQNFAPGLTTVDYNSYYGGSNNPNDTSPHKEVAPGNPFVSVNALDFRLTAGTAAGIILGAPYNKDLLGASRGADGVWDRGAYEFNGASSQGTRASPR